MYPHQVAGLGMMSRQLGDALRMSVEQERQAARMRQMIDASLRPRRTVRITYFRGADLYYVNLVIGDDVISNTVGTNNEDTAEEMADRFSRYYGVDITRKDVP
jgi:hypothetical protein